MSNDRDSKQNDQTADAPSGAVEPDGSAGLADQIRTNPALRARYARAKARRAVGSQSEPTANGNMSAHAAHTAIDKQPGAEATETDWIHYLLDLQAFLRDQTGAEKEQLLDLRQLRNDHPVVGGISESAASIKTLHRVKIPDEGIWDRVFSELNRAHSLLAGEHGDVEGAKAALASAVRLFHDAHRQQYEYRSSVEGGAGTAINVLRGVETACDITLTLLSAGVGAAGANVLKLGARGVFKLAIEQAAKGGLAKTALKAAVVGGLNKLAQGAAQEGTAKAIGADSEFDVGKVIREAGEAAVMNLLGVLVGGALSGLFMRKLGQVLGSRMAPEAIRQLAAKYGVQGAIPPELFVSKGWRFLVGVAGDACTTTLLTGVSVTVEHLRTGGKRPTAEEFVELVVHQLIQNGILQIVLTAVTHQRAGEKASSEPDVSTNHDPSMRGHHDASVSTASSPAQGSASDPSKINNHVREEAPSTAVQHPQQVVEPGQRPRITEPVPGHYDGIHPQGEPHGWTVTQDEMTTNKATGVIKVITSFTDPDGRPGAFERSYDPHTKRLTMNAAFLHPDSPTWLTHDGRMMTSKGTPAQSYWTLRQMRKMGIGFSEVQTVKMSQIQNIETILQLEKAKRDGTPLESVLAKSASVSYAKTPTTQSGGQIVPGSVKKSAGQTLKLGRLLEHYEQIPEFAEARKIQYTKLLQDYGFTRDDDVEYNFNITFELTPADPKEPR